MTFIFFSDHGHGWLKVPHKILEKLGIENLISHCSYQKGTYAYLEEDCDANILLKSLHNRKIDFTIREKNSNRSSRIRSYQHYSPRHVS